MTGMVRLTGPSYASTGGRHIDVPPAIVLQGGTSFPSIALLLTAVALLVPADLLIGPAMTTFACAVLLLGGLPHGALDLAVLRHDAGPRFRLVIALYIGLAIAMAIVWQLAPMLALALFLAMAIAHFAEDWSIAEHPFFAVGIAVASLSAPALFHHDGLSGLFVLLAGTQAASSLADALLLVAPAALASALLATLLLWRAGHKATAANALCSLAAMLLLPPLIGFAIYFCLIHSPMHLQAGLKRLAPARGVAPATVAATLGGLAIAFAALQFLPVSEPSGRWFAACFMTLSILTLPHMAVPMIVRRLGLSAPRRRSGGSPPP